MARKYPIYKGLQKPLEFKGLKGKYIYWAVGSLLAGLVLGALTMSLVNLWLGAIVLVGSVTGGFVFIAAKQKQGLHSKASSRSYFIHPVNFKKLNRHVAQK